MPKKKIEKVEVKLEEVSEDIKEIEIKYNKLINEIKPKLLTNTQLRQGGANIRSLYAKERGYEAILPEINELGKKLGKAPIGLGNLRK